MQEYKRITLNKTLTVAMLLAYAVILVLLILMDWYLIQTYQDKERTQEEAFLERYIEQINADLDNIKDTLYDVYEYNSNFNALSGNLTEMEEYDNVYELDYRLRTRIFLEEYLHGYVLYYSANENVRYYMNSEIIPVEDVEGIKELVKARIEENVSNWQWFSIEINENKYAVLIGKKNNVSLCMIYSLSEMEAVIQKDMKNEEHAIFIDMNANIRRDALQEELAVQLKEHESRYQGTVFGYYVYANRIENTSFWVCVTFPINIYRYLNVRQMILLVITVVSLFLAIFLYRCMRKEMILPLRKLIDTMNQIKDGEWEATMDERVRFEEIRRVNETMETMVAEIKKQRMLSYEQTIEKQQTQLRYLQLQLKPHFYLNSLKTLQVLAMNGETEKIQDLIMNLSYHLRYLLSVERETNTLDAEIDYVKNYEKLQENMTGRPFSVHWNIQVDAHSWNVPTFCIETFVENSFKHAKLGDAAKELMISVTITELDTEDGRFLDICMRDNGAGYDAAALEELNAEPTTDSKRVGINNIKRRCDLLYGELAGYGFYNENGAVSELIIPWQEKMEGIDERIDS